MAAGGCRNSIRHRDDHDAGKESHAGGGRNVFAVRHHIRHLRRRSHTLNRRLGRRAPRIQTARKKARVENAGVLVASGLIAGEALLGLVWAGLQFVPSWGAPNHPPQIFSDPSYLVGGMIVLAGLAALMIFLPVSAAGDPNEPAPPTAMM